jgi:hypothetical protein
MPALRRVVRRGSRALVARLGARPLLRLALGRWPGEEECRCFRFAFGAEEQAVPALLRSVANVPAARAHLTRSMLQAWMAANEPYAGLLRRESHPEGTAMLGDPLRVWNGPPVAFLHLEKTAGSSLVEALTAQFHPLQIDPDPHRTCPPHALTPILPHAVPGIGRHALVWGHYDLPSLCRLGPDRFILTVLREPKARLLSLYRFWRATLREGSATIPSPGVAAAQGSLLQFLRSNDPLVRNALDNCYVRRLTGLYATRPDEDPLAADPAGALERALGALDRLDFVGISEEMDASLSALGTILGFPAPCRAPRVNVTATNAAAAPDRFRHVERPPVGEAEARALEELTRLDQAVYAAAYRRFARLRRERAPRPGRACVPAA